MRLGQEVQELLYEKADLSKRDESYGRTGIVLK